MVIFFKNNKISQDYNKNILTNFWIGRFITDKNLQCSVSDEGGRG